MDAVRFVRSGSPPNRPTSGAVPSRGTCTSRHALNPYGVAFAAKMDALETAGEEAGGPLAGGDGLVLSAATKGGEDDEAGEIIRE